MVNLLVSDICLSVKVFSYILLLIHRLLSYNIHIVSLHMNTALLSTVFQLPCIHSAHSLLIDIQTISDFIPPQQQNIFLYISLRTHEIKMYGLQDVYIFSLKNIIKFFFNVTRLLYIATIFVRFIPGFITFIYIIEKKLIYNSYKKCKWNMLW